MNIYDIRTQKLFGIALVLKVLFSFIGWRFNSPWLFGLGLPIAAMVAYIWIGSHRTDKTVSDEKFADTCYYLGFIFTITSIIFSLLDLPNIGTKIQEIAVRFGAAMISTVLGLAVRVYLVSFRKDAGDAVHDAEVAVLNTTRRFTEQLSIALERLRDFESRVDLAAKSSVERVNIQVENLSKNHAESLSQFYADVTARNQDAFTKSLEEVKTASQRLSESVDGYSHGMRTNLASIESKIVQFTDAVTARLTTTTFPDDYFARHMAEPLAALKSAAKEVAMEVQNTSAGVTESTEVLSAALKKLKARANAADASMEATARLTVQQEAVLDASQTQLTALQEVAATLGRFDELLSGTWATIVASNQASNDLTNRVTDLIADGTQTREAIQIAMGGVVQSMNQQVDAAKTIASAMSDSATESKASTSEIAARLDNSAIAVATASTKLSEVASASQSIAGRLEAISATDANVVNLLDGLGKQAGAAVARVDQAVAQLQAMVKQLATVDASLRAPHNTTAAAHPTPGWNTPSVPLNAIETTAQPAFGQPRPSPTVFGDVRPVSLITPQTPSPTAAPQAAPPTTPSN